MNLFRLLKVIPEDQEITIKTVNYEDEDFDVLFSDEAQELDLTDSELIAYKVKLIAANNDNLLIYITR